MSARLAWVTGATGFLGRHVGRRLAAAGWQVIGFGRSPAPWAPEWGFDAMLSGASDYRRAIERLGPPRAVFHGIGSGSVGNAERHPDSDARATLESLAEVLDALCR